MQNISNHSEAADLLRNSNFKSSRTDLQFSAFEARFGERYETLRKFHSAWPMYSDGVEHQSLRQRVMHSLREVSELDVNETVMRLTGILRDGVLTDVALKIVLTDWHRAFLGLTVEQHTEIFCLAQPILDFFFADALPEGGMRHLETLAQKLGGWFNSQRFAAGRVIDHLCRNGTPPGTMMNLIVDSFDPVYNAVSSLLVMLPSIDAPSHRAADVVHEVLRLYPPFQFINRIAPDGKTRVSIDLFQANRDPQQFRHPDTFNLDNNSRHISFGLGKHACAGAKESMRLLSELCAVLLEMKRCGQFTLRRGSIIQSKGFCGAKDFALDFRAS